MPGSEMALTIEPEGELKFRGPFTNPVTSLLKLTNPTDKRVIFKIKTTAPKRYCVRPNAGVIEPGNNISIAVVLQPCEIEQSANRHKFMVQAIFAPFGEINQDDLWRSSQNVMETKLRCHFDHPQAAPDLANTHDTSNLEPTMLMQSTTTHAETKTAGTVHVQQDEDRHASEDRRLKREIKELREETERLRRKLKQREAADSMLNTGTANPPSQMMAWIVITIIVAMLSLIAGKFLL